MAANKYLAIPLAIFTIWVAFCSSQTSALGFGAWLPIVNLTDPKVVKVAEFAVAEHNKEPKATKLDFVRVKKGDKQLIDNNNGLRYRLVISARTSLKTDDYLAFVHDKYNVLKLTSFEKNT